MHSFWQVLVQTLIQNRQPLPGVPCDGLAAAALALLAAAEPPAGRPLTGVVLLGEVGVVADEVAQQRQPLVPLRLRLGLDVQEVVAAAAAAATTLFSVNSFEIDNILLPAICRI